MKKVQLTNHYLLERSKLLARYAENWPRKADKLELHLDDPYCGLIKMHFKVNDEETLLITASNVYEPFVDIREWLEQIVRHIFDFTTSAVKINDEFDDYLLFYEPIYHHPDEMLLNPPVLGGLFYVYDSCEKKIVSEAFLETKKFVKSIYESIHSYAIEKSRNDEFVDAWSEGAYHYDFDDWDEHDPRFINLFVEKVTSPIVEEFLGNEDSTTRFIPIK